MSTISSTRISPSNGRPTFDSNGLSSINEGSDHQQSPTVSPRSHLGLKRPSSPASHSPRQDVKQLISSAVRFLWQRLCTRKAPAASEYHDSQDVAINDSKEKCLKLACVEIQKDNKKMYLHANRLEIAPLNNHAPNTLEKTSYVVGQSPATSSSTEGMLIHAMETGLGIYQFVSQRTHQRIMDGQPRPPESHKKAQPILEEIQTQLTLHQSSQTRYIIDERYEITGLNKITEGAKNPAADKSCGSNHCHFLLEIRDLKNGTSQSIPITQTGLNFQGKLLRKGQLKEARACLNKHISLQTKTSHQNDIAATVLSHAGIGRNAALIVYSEIEKMIEANHITNPAELDDALEDLITKGRAVRGPHFLHSEAQLQEIRSLCLTSIEDRQSHAGQSNVATPAMVASSDNANPSALHQRLNVPTTAGEMPANVEEPPAQSTTAQPTTAEDLTTQASKTDDMQDIDALFYSVNRQTAHEPAVIKQSIKVLKRMQKKVSSNDQLSLDKTERGIRQYLQTRPSPENALRGLEIVMRREGIHFDEDLAKPTETGYTVPTEMSIVWSYIQKIEDAELKGNLLDSMATRLCEIAIERPCKTGMSQRLIDIPSGVDLAITEDGRD